MTRYFLTSLINEINKKIDLKSSGSLTDKSSVSRNGDCLFVQTKTDSWTEKFIKKSKNYSTYKQKSASMTEFQDIKVNLKENFGFAQRNLRDFAEENNEKPLSTRVNHLAANSYLSTHMSTESNSSSNKLHRIQFFRENQLSLGSNTDFQTEDALFSYNVDQMKLNLIDILEGNCQMTTLMIKNIPNRYNSAELMREIMAEMPDTFDLFYLPIDYENNCNYGYAFINFVDPLHILMFDKKFNAKKWKKYKSNKVEK